MSEETKTSPKISLGMDELRELIAAVVSQSNEQSAHIIAEALVESRKPYVDPRVEANNKMMQTQQKELHERIRAQMLRSRETCPHLQGSNELSEFQGQLTSFAIHQFDTGVAVGICTNCGKTIWSNSDDPEDRRWFAKKSANKMSRAGQRMFMDVAKAQEWAKESSQQISF